ncbi:MAG: ankyrin repeat domain-containing protein [Gallionellaceae bacterium]
MSQKILTALFVLVIAALQICNPAYADKAQDKALTSAVLKGNIEGAKRLIAAGANVNHVSNYGVPLLRGAVDTQNIEMVKTLLAAEAKVNAADSFGDQPIHSAAISGNIELVKVLLAAGSKIDAKGKKGKQPLHDAVQSGNAELVKLLLAAGASVEAVDKEGNTSYSYINVGGVGNPEAVKQVLLAAGAKEVPNRMDKLKPVWLEHIGPQLSLGVSDKLMLKRHYIVKYIVKCETGKIYSVEKTATAGNSPETWQATFPHDFRSDIDGLNIQQAYGCGLSKLTWTIYADDVLIDSGTLISAKKGSH